VREFNDFCAKMTYIYSIDSSIYYMILFEEFKN